MERKCENCEWIGIIGEYGWSCRRYPPKQEGRWPQVWPHEWCGEFEERKEKEKGEEE